MSDALRLGAFGTHCTRSLKVLSHTSPFFMLKTNFFLPASLSRRLPALDSLPSAGSDNDSWFSLSESVLISFKVKDFYSM